LRALPLLLAVGFLDELASGLPSAGANLVRRDFELDHTALALLVLVMPQLGALLEAPLIALADRWPRKRAIAAGLAGMAASLLGCAWAKDAIVFGAAFALYGPAAGVADGFAQASLMDAEPDHRERRMTEWALAGYLGDLAAPLSIGAVRLLGASWRMAFVLGAMVLLVAALGTLAAGRAREGRSGLAVERSESGDESEPAFSTTAAIRVALRDRVLLAWLAGAVLTSLLDETLATFAVVLVRERFGAGALAETTLLSGFTVAGALSLAFTDRLLRTRSPMPILAWSSIACALCLVAWLTAGSLPAAVLAFAAVGAFAAPLYPIAKAQAFRALPERAGLVNAIGALFLPFDLAAPLVIGAIADRAGLQFALLLLLLQPVALAILALFGQRMLARGNP
jgi:MFS family permease